MMNSFSIFGKLKNILPLMITPSGFKKLEFIILTDENVRQNIKFELHNDKVNLLSNLVIGDEIEVYFNFRGKEWVNSEGKSIYFNSFVCWKIRRIVNNYPVPIDNDKSPHLQYNFNLPPAEQVFNDEHDIDNDLPF